METVSPPPEAAAVEYALYASNLNLRRAVNTSTVVAGR
jgi:hypothetical protein